MYVSLSNSRNEPIRDIVPKSNLWRRSKKLQFVNEIYIFPEG